MRLRMVLIATPMLCLCALLAASAPGATPGPADDGRTVIDNERGGYFMYPFQGDWSALGADFGLGYTSGYRYGEMDPEALKGIHGRLQHFELQRATNFSSFPTDLLLRYNADEVAQVRPPLLVTATYQGKPRPVLMSWHALGGWGNSQAVNIADERFVRFFIKQYVRSGLMAAAASGWWVGLDNAAFDYSLYGVWDDGHHFVSEGVVWDKPFPQNAQEWMDAAKSCFQRISDDAPDILLIANEGSQPDESQYGAIFQHVRGVMYEDFMMHEDWYRKQITGFHFARAVGPDVNKVQIFQVSVGPHDQEERLRSSYCAYLIWRGPNAFFGPLGEGSREVDPAQYAAMKNQLGHPVGPAHMEQEPGKERQFQLFWREVEGGLVYQNLTGATKTVMLPAERTWYDPSGEPITRLTLRDWEGGYALREPGARCAWPMINPRCPELTTGPLEVTLSTEPWTSGAEVRYALDGAEPTERSPLYQGPISLIASCLVKAKAFRAGMLPSFTEKAAYTLTRMPPKVAFHLASDEGSDFLNDYPLVALDHPSAQPVIVHYAVTGGTAVNGRDYLLEPAELTVSPGEKYVHFEVPVIRNKDLNQDSTIEITLSDPKNATLGKKKTYTYTIRAAIWNQHHPGACGSAGAEAPPR